MKAVFLKSSHNVSQCPADTLPEFLLIGRSNVGKSSLVNAIIGQNIAKTSSTPGKTILINHFLIDKKRHLVDLPGYGYAKRSKSKRAGRQKTLWEYLDARENIEYVCVLIDASISLQEIDLEFMNSLADEQIPFIIILTKTDKLNQSEIHKETAKKKATFLKERKQLPPMFLTSGKNKRGIKELTDFFEKEVQSNDKQDIIIENEDIIE